MRAKRRIDNANTAVFISIMKIEIVKTEKTAKQTNSQIMGKTIFTSVLYIIL